MALTSNYIRKVQSLEPLAFIDWTSDDPSVNLGTAGGNFTFSGDGPNETQGTARGPDGTVETFSDVSRNKNPIYSISLPVDHLRTREFTIAGWVRLGSWTGRMLWADVNNRLEVEFNQGRLYMRRYSSDGKAYLNATTSRLDPLLGSELIHLVIRKYYLSDGSPRLDYAVNGGPFRGWTNEWYGTLGSSGMADTVSFRGGNSYSEANKIYHLDQQLFDRYLTSQEILDTFVNYTPEQEYIGYAFPFYSTAFMLDAGAIGGASIVVDASPAQAAAEMGRAYVDLAGHATVLADAVEVTGEFLTPGAVGHALVAVEAAEGHTEAFTGTVDAETNAVVLAAPAGAAVDMPGGAGEDNWLVAVDTTEMYRAVHIPFLGSGRNYEIRDLKEGENVVVNQQDLWIKIPSRRGRDIKQDSIEYTLHFYDAVDTWGYVYGVHTSGTEMLYRPYLPHFAEIPFPEGPRPIPRPITLKVKYSDPSAHAAGILFSQLWTTGGSRTYRIKNPNVPGSGSFVTYLYKPAPIPALPSVAQASMSSPTVQTDKNMVWQARPAKAFGEMLRGTAPHAFSDATVMDATAEMPMPQVSLSNSVVAPTMEATAYFHTPLVMFSREAVVRFSTVNVLADMPGGVYANVTIKAGVATNNAHMGAAWFRSDKVINAPAPENTLGEMNQMNSIQADRNISVPTTAAVASAYIVAPLEVDETVSDPYWMRVTRRATTGVNPPAPYTNLWVRFNQRSGSEVNAINIVSGLPFPRPRNNSSGSLDGLYEWGADAPNGKRGLRVHDAMLDFGEASGGLTRPLESSIEFTFRIEPGHTGRMDIFNGRTRYTGQGGSWVYESHASIRDGHLYMRGLKGGTSTMRLDDGNWHHVVMSGKDGSATSRRDPVEIYIDGKLDRAFVTEENRNSEPFVRAGAISKALIFFGHDTGYPFKGDIVDYIFRESAMNATQVAELYYDMFGHKPIRPGIAQATADMYQGTKSVSGMKRMLLLSWQGNFSGWGGRTRPQNPPTEGATDAVRRAFNHSITVSDRGDINLSEFFTYEGDEGNSEAGQYLVTHQMVDRVRPGDAVTEHKGDDAGRGYTLFRDPITGKDRLIDIFNDINLDSFDIIAFQAYPNPPMNTQAARERYEPFLDSINKALVRGYKLWVTDPYLMADLGWIERPETVPVLGIYPVNRIPEVAGYWGYLVAARGNDVRSYDIAPPFHDPYGYPKPAVRPENGAMPTLRWITDESGSHYNMWGSDIHRNNGYRVINEVEGLTDIPSWEVKEAAHRTRAAIFNDRLEHAQRAYMYENREGLDYEWTYTENSGEEHELVTPSSGRGLRVGDEFYDWKWIDYGLDLYKYQNSTSTASATATRQRAPRTWAIPPGALRIGTPLTTFRSTQHNDYGNEVENPWRNHIRNFVIRPGDTLPGYGKVSGYVYADLAEQPELREFGVLGMPKHLTAPPGVEPPGFNPNSNSTVEVETEETFQWDFSTWGRRIYGATGSANVTGRVAGAKTVDADGKISYSWQIGVVDTLPVAQRVSSAHAIKYVPHATWNARGISWLTSVDRTDAEYSNTLGETARATAEMRTPTVSVEFERTVHVSIAEATADIVAPEEAQVRDARFFARPATAWGVMLNRIITVAPTPATGFADMPQNIQRPLDIEEVLFSSTTFSNEIIYLRLEEN